MTRSRDSSLGLKSFFLVGPTGVGKSELAAELAARFGAEVVGADAFQVYRGLDILTAKPSVELRARAPHHLIGVVPLSQTFDVAQYVRMAGDCLEQIAALGKVAIVVGGTGLYLRALTRGLSVLPPADWEIRARLEALTLEELQARLHQLDPEAFATIDGQNRRRVVRALEVCELTGIAFSAQRGDWSRSLPPIHGVFLTRARDDLYERINRRVVAMFADGLLDEIHGLTEEPSSTAGQVLGLREARACLRGDLTAAAAIDAIQRATRRYAKRQLTWFNREPMLARLDLSPFSDLQSVVQRLAQYAGFDRLPVVS